MLTYSVSITRLKKNLMEGGSGLIDNFNEKWFGHQANKLRTTHQRLHKNANGTFTLPAFAGMICEPTFDLFTAQFFYTENNFNAPNDSTAISWFVSPEKSKLIILTWKHCTKALDSTKSDSCQIVCVYLQIISIKKSNKDFLFCPQNQTKIIGFSREKKPDEEMPLTAEVAALQVQVISQYFVIYLC